MSLLNLELSSVLAGDIGWTLVHFLWQGMAMALLLQAILPFCRSAVARHNWSLGMLAAMCLAPVITFLWRHGDGRAAPASVATTFASHNLTIAVSGGFAPASVSVPWTGWLVGFWLAGIALLSLRALGGLVLAQGLRRNGWALPDDLLQRCHNLQRRLAVSLPVRFLLSRHVAVPVVVGWLSPVILLPVSAIMGLAPQQLDALILHELAHIRRLDMFINLFLIMAETILFYHPAIWWVSRRVRIEREHCCDDVAVAHCGGAAIYVEALASLEMGRAMPVLALAANGGRLKDRAARLLGASSDRSRISLSAIAGLAFLSLVVGTVATAQINAPGVHAQSPGPYPGAEAKQYVKEHEKGISSDAYDIADSLEHDQALLDEDKHVRLGVFFSKLGTLTKDRGLLGSYIVDGNGKVLGSTKKQFFKDPKPPSATDFTRARAGSIMVDANLGTVTALIQLHILNDAYLLVVRQTAPGKEQEQPRKVVPSTAPSNVPISIRSDSFHADPDTKSGLWTGNVVVTQGDMKLHSNQVRVLTVNGKPDKIYASGNVVVDSPNSGTATGENSVYSVRPRTVVVTGDVVLKRKGKGEFHGSQLTLDMNTGRGVFTQNSQSQ
jgi:lipopolysaccharide transport protein LptA